MPKHTKQQKAALREASAKSEKPKSKKTGQPRKHKYEGNIVSKCADGRTIYRVNCSNCDKACYTSVDHKASDNWECTNCRPKKEKPQKKAKAEKPSQSLSAKVASLFSSW